MSSESMGQTLMRRLQAFAEFTDVPGEMTRLYLSAAHRRAADDLMRQLKALGLSPQLDAIGNVQARFPGSDPDAPSVMIGSHIDTVRNAGIYDGNLGVFAAVGVIEALQQSGARLRCPIDLVAFGDEEGVRFPTTLGGSRAIAGTFELAALQAKDEDGLSLDAALRSFGCVPERIPALARPKGSVRAYLEMHIEQGPVLEAEHLPVGIVTAINGAVRYRISVKGLAGHAGTVPMSLRQDALAAAAEMVLAVETIGQSALDLVATVGRIEARPGAVNVIPGEAIFTLDVRAPDNTLRKTAAQNCLQRFQDIADQRRVSLTIEPSHDADAVPCDPLIDGALERAIAAAGLPVRRLPSGAGHDGMAMAALCPIGMLFVRCKGGISHNPLESITLEDAETAMAVMLAAVRELAL